MADEKLKKLKYLGQEICKTHKKIVDIFIQAVDKQQLKSIRESLKKL